MDDELNDKQQQLVKISDKILGLFIDFDASYSDSIASILISLLRIAANIMEDQVDQGELPNCDWLKDDLSNLVDKINRYKAKRWGVTDENKKPTR